MGHRRAQEGFQEHFGNPIDPELFPSIIKATFYVKIKKFFRNFMKERHEAILRRHRLIYIDIERHSI